MEYQKGNDCVMISETEANQSVYIFKCENSTVQVTQSDIIYRQIRIFLDATV